MTHGDFTPDDWKPLDPDVFGSGLLSDTIDAYRERIRDLEAEIERLKAENAALRQVVPYQRKWD